MCKWVLALLCLLSLAFGAVAQTSSVPPLMNYQGKLTKPDGSPVDDGQYKVRFSIHDALTGGAEKWFQTMDPVLVRNGVFSVLLGSGNPLSADVFSGTRYLEIKVGDLAPLSPRQPIVSVGYSFVAQKAEVATTAVSVQNGGVGTGGLADGSVTTAKLANSAVTTAKLATGSVTESKLAPGLTVPVGSVVAWWGDSTNVPAGWKVCDGTAVSDATSPINGLTVPDMTDRFVRGALGNVRTNIYGGADSYTLSIAQLPAHAHDINDPGHTHNLLAQAWARADGTSRAFPINTGSFIEPSPIVGATTGITIRTTGGGQPFPTVPRHVGLVWIMRIR